MDSAEDAEEYLARMHTPRNRSISQRLKSFVEEAVAVQASGAVGGRSVSARGARRDSGVGGLGIGRRRMSSTDDHAASSSIVSKDSSDDIGWPLKNWTRESGTSMSGSSLYSNVTSSSRPQDAFAGPGLAHRASYGASQLSSMRYVHLPMAEPSAVLSGHVQGVSFVALSADGRVAMSSAYNGTELFVWDTRHGGKRLHSLVVPTHTNGRPDRIVGPVALSANGCVVGGTCSEGKRVVLWCVETGTVRGAITASSSETVVGLALSKDGSSVFLSLKSGKSVKASKGSRSGSSIVRYDALGTSAPPGLAEIGGSSAEQALAIEKCINTLYCETRRWSVDGVPGECATSDDAGTFAYVVEQAKEASVWVHASRTGERIAKFDGLEAGGVRVFLEPNGRYVLVADKHNRTLGDVQNDKAVALRASPAYLHTMSCAIQPDGTGVVLSTEECRSVVMSDLVSGKYIARLDGLRCKGSPTAVSHCGNCVISGDVRDSAVLLWDVEETQFSEPLVRRPLPVSNDESLGQGSSSVATPVSGSLMERASKTYAQYEESRSVVPATTPSARMRGHREGVSYVSISDDGAVAMSSVSRGSEILLWNTAGPDHFIRRLHRKDANHVRNDVFTGIQALSGDGTLAVASFASSRKLAVWSTTTGKEMSRPLCREGSIFTSVALTSDGMNIIAAMQGALGKRGSIVSFASRGGVERSHFSVDGQPSACAVSDDGSIIAYVLLCKRRKSVVVQDGITGVVLSVFDDIRKAGAKVFLDPTGTYVLVADSHQLTLRSVKGGTVIARSTGPEDLNSLSAAVFDDGSATAVATRKSRSIAVWNIRTGTAIARLEGLRCGGSSTAVNRKASRVLACDPRDAAVLSWVLDAPADDVAQTAGTSGPPHIVRVGKTSSDMLGKNAGEQSRARSGPLPTTIQPSTSEGLICIFAGVVISVHRAQTSCVHIAQQLRKALTVDHLESTSDVLVGHSLSLLAKRTGVLDVVLSENGSPTSRPPLLAALYDRELPRSICKDSSDQQLVALVREHARVVGLCDSDVLISHSSATRSGKLTMDTFRRIDRYLLEMAEAADLVDTDDQVSVNILASAFSQLKKSMEHRSQLQFQCAIARATLAYLHVAARSSKPRDTPLSCRLIQGLPSDVTPQTAVEPTSQCTAVDISNQARAAGLFDPHSTTGLSSHTEYSVRNAAQRSAFERLAAVHEALRDARAHDFLPEPVPSLVDVSQENGNQDRADGENSLPAIIAFDDLSHGDGNEARRGSLDDTRGQSNRAAWKPHDDDGDDSGDGSDANHKDGINDLGVSNDDKDKGAHDPSTDRHIGDAEDTLDIATGDGTAAFDVGDVDARSSGSLSSQSPSDICLREASWPGASSATGYQQCLALASEMCATMRRGRDILGSSDSGEVRELQIEVEHPDEASRNLAIPRQRSWSPDSNGPLRHSLYSSEASSVLAYSDSLLFTGDGRLRASGFRQIPVRRRGFEHQVRASRVFQSETSQSGGGVGGGDGSSGGGGGDGGGGDGGDPRGGPSRPDRGKGPGGEGGKSTASGQDACRWKWNVWTYLLALTHDSNHLAWENAALSLLICDNPVPARAASWPDCRRDTVEALKLYISSLTSANRGRPEPELLYSGCLVQVAAKFVEDVLELEKVQHKNLPCPAYSTCRKTYKQAVRDHTKLDLEYPTFLNIVIFRVFLMLWKFGCTDALYGVRDSLLRLAISVRGTTNRTQKMQIVENCVSTLENYALALDGRPIMRTEDRRSVFSLPSDDSQKVPNESIDGANRILSMYEHEITQRFGLIGLSDGRAEETEEVIGEPEEMEIGEEAPFQSMFAWNEIHDPPIDGMDPWNEHNHPSHHHHHHHHHHQQQQHDAAGDDLLFESVMRL